MLSWFRSAWQKYIEQANQKFMVCPDCGQWGQRGQCVWCGFQATDETALAALKSQRALAADQRQQFLRLLWQPLKVSWLSSTASSAKYMVCPQCHQWGQRGVCQWCGFNALDDKAVGLLRAEDARYRAERRARWQRVYQTVTNLFRIDPHEHTATVKMIAKWTVLGSLAGGLAGSASAAFLLSLQWATNLRLAHPELLFLLPLIGFLVGWVYFRYAGSAARGNNLIIEEVNVNREPIPLRMAPLVLAGTVLTHLFGGSAGREGTAIQMGSSLADWLQRKLGLSQEDRRLMLLAGISGGFGSVFGTPLAGFVFGLEVQNVGRIRYDAIVPCLVAAVVGDLVARAWGVTHSHYARLVGIDLEPLLLLKVTLAAAVFGLISLLFIELTHGIKYLLKALLGWSPLRPLVGGLAVIGLTFLVGTQDYLGLSLPLIQHSLDGTGVTTWAFLFKIIFTAITLGAGFLGGEVTPLFVIGSTLGFTLGSLLGVDPTFMAAIGFVAVFAGASNTPLACALMGIELFGGGSALYLLVGCFVAYLASGHRSIYGTQRVSVPKVFGLRLHPDESLETVSERRRGWLPEVPALTRVPGERLVRAVMSPNAVSVTTDTPIEQLVELVVREGVRTLPVLDQSGLVVGIVTDNDLLRRSGLAVRLGLMASLTLAERANILRPLNHLVAKDVMTAPAITVLHTAPLHSAAALMIPQHLKRVPVVDQNRHLLGMVTRSDLLRELTFSEAAPLWTDEGGERPIAWDTAVGEFMMREVSSVLPTLPLDAVIQQMLNATQKRIVVINDMQQVIGIITDGDLLARAQVEQRLGLLNLLAKLWRPHDKSALSETLAASPHTAADIMTAPVVTISQATSAREALRLIMAQRVKRLPVVADNGRLVGMVGRAGLMRALLNAAVTSRTQPSVGPLTIMDSGS